MVFNHYNFKAVWANRSLLAVMDDLVRYFRDQLQQTHWSRCFEYPWAYLNGMVHQGQWLLDAGGGNGVFQHVLSSNGCQVINVDLDPSSQRGLAPGVLPIAGDLRRLSRFHSCMFDRVFCVSVLEHIERPQEVVAELWRVLKPGGKMVVTMDVADYARHNHTIDDAIAAEICGLFGQPLPPRPKDVLAMRFDELEDDAIPRNDHVFLNVLCFFAGKR